MKHITITKVLIGILLFTIVSCSDKRKEEVAKTVDSFFQNYKGDYRTVDTKLLSNDLADLIQKSVTKEELEAEKVKESEYPTDKPLIVEGDVFSSLYEGQDSYKIDEIKIDNNKATISVEFSNSTYKEKWKDKLVLVDENGWKIDDVIYSGHKIEFESAKEGLKNFILYEEE